MSTGDILGIGLGNAVSTGLGMLAGANAQQQQVRDQKELMELGSKLAYDNWLKTNYKAQRGQMEKAGLNVGLMYNGQGGGGQLSSGSAGSASKADVPIMDLGNAIAQGRMIESQIKVNEAQALKLKTDANKTAGVDTDLTKTQIEGNIIANAFNNENFETALNKAKAELESVNANTVKAVAEGKLSTIDAVTRNWDNTERIINTMANTNKMNESVKQDWERLKQGWRDLELKSRGLDIDEQKSNIQKFAAETQRNYPGLMNVTGNIVNDGLKSIYRLFGLDKDDNDTTTKINK